MNVIHSESELPHKMSTIPFQEQNKTHFELLYAIQSTHLMRHATYVEEV